MIFIYLRPVSKKVKNCLISPFDLLTDGVIVQSIHINSIFFFYLIAIGTRKKCGALSRGK